ncbi:MAG TPA: PEP-utilizing enzyme, partial [Candidatus Paceibacterota bacterium]|nr:PEP-utilizing enzyme [Candidatus Paceibacterota bacterium]
NKDGNVRFIDKIVWPQGFVADTGQKTFEETVIRGDTASKGYAKGKVRLIADAKSLKKIRTGEIIVAQMVAPSFGPAIQDVSAVITDEGGITSHAAIIAREMGIPCIVKTKTATKILETGDLVEVDANAGLVKILKRK